MSHSDFLAQPTSLLSRPGVGAEWWHQRPGSLCLCSSTALSVEFAASRSQGGCCSSRPPVVMSGRWGTSNDLFLRRFVFYSESPADILGMCVLSHFHVFHSNTDSLSLLQGNQNLDRGLVCPCFYKQSFTETHPCPFIQLLSTAASMPSHQSWVVMTRT